LSVRDLGEATAAGAKVVDGKGAYAIPGLIDTHVHLATSPNRRAAEALMRRDLYGGITAERDMAGDTRALADLARAALLKEIAAPDLYYSALMAGPAFFHDKRTISSAQGAVPGQVPWMQAITESTDLRVAVAYARGTWATGIKIYADLPGDLVGKITAEAHRQGIEVWSHATIFPARPHDAVNAGVDVISHVCLIAYEASPTVPPEYHHRAQPDYAKIDVENPSIRDLFDQMARQRTILDATLRVYAEDERQREASKAKKDPNTTPPPPGCPLGFAARLTNAAYRHGVLISTGTDGTTPRENPYPPLDEELALLQHRAGIPAAQVLKSATLVGAMTLGLEHELGSLQPGKLASFVLLAKNPLADVSNVRSVIMTVKRGTPYPRERYRPISADEWPESDGP
jgi:imidazolonepropionase-like amidohydrolase